MIALADDQVALGLFSAFPLEAASPLRIDEPGAHQLASAFDLAPSGRAVRGEVGRPAAARRLFALHSLAQLGVALEQQTMSIAKWHQPYQD